VSGGHREQGHGSPAGWIYAATIAVALSLLVTSGDAFAADAERGLLLARSWCSFCHMVEPGVKASDTAPPFETIARDPAITPQRLQAWLAKPHPPMPDLKLSRDEESDLLAYIRSLKTP
jgi:hypothetical protein